MRHPTAPTPPPSALRIGALSSAMALNLAAVFGLTLMQTASPPDLAKPPPAPPLQFDIITRQPPPPAPPMPRTPERPKPREVTPPVVQPPAPLVVESAWQSEIAIAPPSVSPVESAPAAAEPATGESARVSLRYITATPPKYPPLARRRGQQGEVILRVHVGTDGRPLSVEVDEGSGHTLLDRAAREHVLATWRFEPARVGGQIVEAWGRVPIVFALN